VGGAAERVGQRQVGHAVAELGTLAGQDGEAPAGGQPGDLADQAGLAHPGVATDQCDHRTARLGVVELGRLQGPLLGDAALAQAPWLNRESVVSQTIFAALYAGFIDRYADRTGADVSSVNWYATFAMYKLAALYEYSRRRFRSGVGDPYYADPDLVTSFLAAGERLAADDSTLT